MLKIFKIILIALTANYTSAEIIDLGNITRDTATGLDWLDLTETTGYSANDILGGAGGWKTEGYTHANTEQIITLFQNLGIPYIGPGAIPENLQPVLDATTLLGVTIHNDAGRTTSLGYYFGANIGSFQVNTAVLSALHVQGAGHAQVEDYYVHDFSTDSINFGHFLVRPAEIPIPPAGLLFVSAIVSALRIQRKSHNNPCCRR